MVKFIFTLIAYLASLFAAVGFIHIFQLNSYRHKRYFRWAASHKGRFLQHAVILFLGVIFRLCLNNAAGCIVLSVFLAALTVHGFKKKAKKQLVYTKRIIRLLTTVSVVYAVLFALSAFSKNTLLYMAALYAVSGFIILLCDCINMPIEKSINNYYINDAKKILKSAKGRLKVIGVTGSYGKTSVKFFLASLLSAKYNVLATPESFNTPLGVVKTIRSSLSAIHNVFICEMGAKNVGDIKEICDIVSPDHGIITSIGPQHLETFKTLDNVKKTKFELADSINGGGFLFLNGDDENIISHNKNKNAITYGFGALCDYRAEIISVTEHGTEFKITAKNGESEVYATKLIGAHNVINITGAAACANTLGVSLGELKPQIRKLQAVPHRLELINRGNVSIIDDAYNSNPAGAKAAVETLALFDGIKILVTPGMVELGAKQDECNFNFGALAAGVCDFVALVGKKQTESILKGLLSENYPTDRIFVAENLNEAMEKVYSLNTEEHKIILLENDLPDNYL